MGPRHLFPAKGDPRKPPEWLGRALLYIAIAIVGFTFCWRSWGKIEYLVIDIIVSLFIALAVEPVVVPLVKHGWKRSFASLFSLLMLAVMLGVLFTLFGNLFVQQMIALVNGLPDLYEQMCQFASQYANFQLPEINNLGNEILKNIQTSWVTDFAGTALNTVSGLFSFLINLMTIIMTTYYISAAGPKLRRAACQWMAPAAQRRFLFVWTVSQSQISSFLFSRAILALLNAFFTGICLMLLHVPIGYRWRCSAVWFRSSFLCWVRISAARCQCCSHGVAADCGRPWRCWCLSACISRSRI